LLGNRWKQSKNIQKYFGKESKNSQKKTVLLNRSQMVSKKSQIENYMNNYYNGKLNVAIK